MRALIVKTSSMGDVVHNFPVVTDMKEAVPECHIDWVVEEAYAGLVALHPGVDRVIPIAQRRWRKNRSAAMAEMQHFEAALSEHAYDLVLDTQGLVKSALIARQAGLRGGGRRVGFSRRLAKEGLARMFYDEGFDVDPHLHAVERLRSLSAQALQYPIRARPRFGLAVQPLEDRWVPSEGFAVLLHATSRPEKSWTFERWVGLGQLLAEQNITSVLLHGNESEFAAAQAMGSKIPSSIVAPRLDLPAAASLLAGARLVVGVDTGLTHLAAALDVSTITLFAATPRWRYAPYWSDQTINLGNAGRQPELEAAWTATKRLLSL